MVVGAPWVGDGLRAPVVGQDAHDQVLREDLGDDPRRQGGEALVVHPVEGEVPVDVNPPALVVGLGPLVLVVADGVGHGSDEDLSLLEELAHLGVGVVVGEEIVGELGDCNGADPLVAVEGAGEVELGAEAGFVGCDGGDEDLTEGVAAFGV